MSKRKPPALLDWESAGGDQTNDALGVTAGGHSTRFPNPTDVGNIVYRLRLYANASEAIVITAADAVGIADLLQHLSAHVDELEHQHTEATG